MALLANETGFLPVVSFVRERRCSYEWGVDPKLEQVANRCVETSDSFVPRALPIAEPGHAEEFYRAFEGDSIMGRCVRLGSETPVRPYYHCTIGAEASASLELDDLWDSEVWPTERYRRQRPRGS